MEAIFLLLIKSILAGISAVGFAMVFNVPKSTLIYCFFGGAITFTSRYFLLGFGMQIELATFFASLLIGIISFYWSRKKHIPRPTYTVASIIPIIPGKYAIAAMITLVKMNSQGVSQDLIFSFIDNMLKASSILAAISFGIALPSLYFMRLNRHVV